ncbi:MAG: hypothetical protein IJ679_09080, partial [Lachnospiraceae bacterium]|nr:hypothetical protein [Lachnospiraceae bacterium]
MRRVILSSVRRMLICEAVIMDLWLAAREFKWYIVEDPDIIRWLWYGYYIPMLLLPLLALYVSLYLGKREDCRLPRSAVFLALQAAALMLLVLTNDWHQMVFRFPQEAEVWGESSYEYGGGFFLILAWIFSCTMAAFRIMFLRCRIPKSGRLLWSPIVVYGLDVVYVALYALRVPFVLRILGDVAVVHCLIIMSFFETCLACGLIHSNMLYGDLFESLDDVNARIVDEHYQVKFAARRGISLSNETMRLAEKEPVLLSDGRRLYNMHVHGGHMLWTKDISELLALQETLQDRQEELRTRQEFLRLEFEQERAHRRVVEQNRLYDLVLAQTREEMGQIRRLVRRFRRAKEKEKRQRILSEIVFVGGYIKRRKDFVLSIDENPMLSEKALVLAFQESLQALLRLGIRGGCRVHTKSSEIEGDRLLAAYDLFYYVAKGALFDARYLNVIVGNIGEGLRVTVETDSASIDEGALRRRFAGLAVETDEDGKTFVLSLEGR